MRILFILIMLLALLSSCKRDTKPKYFSVTTETAKWELVWNEEFDYQGFPDTTKWSYDTQGNASGWGNNESQFYTNADSLNAWVDDDMLTITARKDSMEGKAYTSARLLSRHKGDWLYGRFEIRAKLPTGVGTWSAIWMLPTDWEYGGWPASGEIDIMENVGYNPDSIVGTVHLAKYNHTLGTQKGKSLYSPNSDKDFLTYVLEWEPDECRIYQDSTHYFTFKNEGKGSEYWPFDKRFHLLLNLAIGGSWGGAKGVDDTLFPHRFQIDYVRVYKKID